MDDFINKEIDKWLATSRSIDHSEQEANLRAMLVGAYKEGKNSFEEGDTVISPAAAKKLADYMCKQARTDLIAELVGKVREEKGTRFSEQEGVKGIDYGFDDALDRAIEIIKSLK